MITEFLKRRESLSYLHNIEDTDILASLDDEGYAEQLSDVMAQELFDLVIAHNIRYIFVYIGAPDGLLFADKAVALKRQYRSRKIKVGAFYLAGDIELLPHSLQKIADHNLKTHCDTFDIVGDSDASLKGEIAIALAKNASHYIHLCNQEKALNFNFKNLRETFSCIYPVSGGFAVKRFGPQD